MASRRLRASLPNTRSLPELRPTAHAFTVVGGAQVEFKESRRFRKDKSIKSGYSRAEIRSIFQSLSETHGRQASLLMHHFLTQLVVSGFFLMLVLLCIALDVPSIATAAVVVSGVVIVLFALRRTR